MVRVVPRVSVVRVPLKRRLQTAGVVVSFAVPFVCGLCNLLVLWYWFLWPVAVALWTWVFLDRHTPHRFGRALSRLRKWRLWQYYIDYFPMRLVVEQKLPPGQPYIFCVHPHGIISLSTWGNLAAQIHGAEEKLGVPYRIATVYHHFLLPLWRDFILGMGFVDASPSTFDYILERKGAIVVIVGGAAEALDAQPGRNDLTLIRRRGFVRQALKHGASLVPVFSFGETDLYQQKVYPRGSRVRTCCEHLREKLGFSLPQFIGRGIFNYDFGVMPFRRPVTTVVGKPLTVPVKPHPTHAEVEEVHTAYVAALKDLHERYKSVNVASGGAISQMAIVE